MSRRGSLGKSRFVHKAQTGHYVFLRITYDVQTSDIRNEEKSEWESLGGIDAKAESSPEEYSSVCDVWKDSVHKVITKIEYQTPIYIQAYSQMHSEFLHSIDNAFGTCYIWQKRYFDRMGFDQKSINAYEKMCSSATSNTIDWLDVYANYKKFESDLTIEYMKIGNSCLRWWVDMFGKTMSSWKF